MKATDPSAPIPAASGGAAGAKKLHWGKVLRIVIPVALLMFAAVALFRFGDMEALLSGLTRPKLVPAGGQILFQGKPLLNARIMTYPVGGRGLPALGWTDEEGRFALKTDIQGNYVDGASVGEHKVTVASFLPAAGPGAPALLTPPQYASAGTSPLRITISRNPADNHVEFVLEGEPPSRQGGGPPGGEGKGKGGQGKRGKGTGEKAKTEDSGDSRADSQAPAQAENESEPAQPQEGDEAKAEEQAVPAGDEATPTQP